MSQTTRKNCNNYCSANFAFLVFIEFLWKIWHVFHYLKWSTNTACSYCEQSELYCIKCGRPWIQICIWERYETTGIMVTVPFENFFSLRMSWDLITEGNCSTKLTIADWAEEDEKLNFLPIYSLKNYSTSKGHGYIHRRHRKCLLEGTTYPTTVDISLQENLQIQLPLLFILTPV